MNPRSAPLLLQSEVNFRLLADYTLDWEYLLNSAGKYVYMSSACEQITGYSKEDFMNDPTLLHRLIVPDSQEMIISHFQEEKNEEVGTYKAEFLVKHRDGTEKWLEHNCTPIFDDKGKYAGRRGSNHDITQRVHTEDERMNLEVQLRQVQRYWYHRFYPKTLDN